MQCANATNDLSIEIEDDTIFLFLGFDLVCLANVFSPTIYVCNPATRDVFSLPSYGQMSVDTTSKYVLFGFAYLRLTNEYIVVRTFGNEINYDIDGPDNNPILVEMFKFDEHTNLECPSSSSWRMAKKTSINYYEDTMQIQEGPFVERNMNWLILSCSYEVSIFSFDIDEELFYKIDIPTGIYDTYLSSHEEYRLKLIPFELVDLNGKLGFLDRVIVDDNCFTMSLWLLQEKHESMWVKYYTIEFDCFNLRSVRNSFKTVARCLYMSGKELLFCIDERTLYSYNIENKVFTQVQANKLFRQVQETIKSAFKLHIGGFLRESMFHIQRRPKAGYLQHLPIILKLELLPKRIE